MTPQTTDPAILFDLDGTLVDTAYEHVLAWSAALRTTNLVVPNWKIHRRIGMSGRALVGQLMRDLGRERFKVRIEALEKRHDAAFNQIVSGIRPLSAARDRGTGRCCARCGEPFRCWFSCKGRSRAPRC
jgi:beta-phosphoglucomutase-like phosphatase (HAD superfamily)